MDGKPVKAVAQITKQAFTFVFDRVTGKPVWPIEERPVAASTVPGEITSPTQPFPTKPAQFDRNGIGPDDVNNLTPEIKAEALRILSEFKTGPVFTPSIRQGEGGKKATLIVPHNQGAATGKALPRIRKPGCSTSLRRPRGGPARWSRDPHAAAT